MNSPLFEQFTNVKVAPEALIVAFPDRKTITVYINSILQSVSVCLVLIKCYSLTYLPTQSNSNLKLYYVIVTMGTVQK